jgi:hypothetical protein
MEHDRRNTVPSVLHLCNLGCLLCDKCVTLGLAYLPVKMVDPFTALMGASGRHTSGPRPPSCNMA